MSARQIRRDMERLRGTVRARSSVTGRWATLRWALAHPRIAVLSRLRCRAAMSYATTQELTASPGQKLPPVPTIRCELPKGHPGTHLAGAQSWST